MLEKPSDSRIKQDHALSMVQCKVVKQLELLEAQKFDDQDINDDIEFLQESLQSSVQDLRFVLSTTKLSLHWNILYLFAQVYR